jgi:DNA polymerase-4
MTALRDGASWVHKSNPTMPPSRRRRCVTTIGELARADPISLQVQFGRSTGVWLHEAAHGIDERPVITFSEPKSISRETTFEHDLHPRHDRAALS